MVLRIITGKTDLQLVSCETQADLKRVTGAKSILLDAYGTDSMGKSTTLKFKERISEQIHTVPDIIPA